jgi:hypothetical protein
MDFIKVYSRKHLKKLYKLLSQLSLVKYIIANQYIFVE